MSFSENLPHVGQEKVQISDEAFAATLEKNLAAITPDALSILRLLSVPSAFLPAMLFARQPGFRFMRDIVSNGNTLQGIRRGWQIEEATPREIASNAKRLGLADIVTSDGTENGPVAQASMHETNRALVYATGGHLAHAMQHVWNGGLPVSSHDLLGAPVYEPSQQDTVWMRTRVFTILSQAYQTYGESFHMTVEQLAHFVGVGMDRLRPHLRMLNDVGVLTSIVRERGTYAFVQEANPDTFKSMQGVGSNELREVYTAIQTLLQDAEDTDAGNISQFSVNTIREVLRMMNPDSPILKKQGETDGVPAALSMLRKMGVVRTIDTTAVSLSEEQFALLAPMTAIIEKLVQRDELFIADGKLLADTLLDDSQALSDFMKSERSFARRGEPLAKQRAQLVRLFLEKGRMSTNQIIGFLNKESSIVRGQLLRPLRSLGMLRSESIQGAVGGEVSWELVQALRVKRILTEGGILVLDKESRTSDKVLRAKVLAVGKNMDHYAEQLPKGSLRYAIDEAILDAPSAISYIRMGISPNNEERAILIVHPEKLTLFKKNRGDTFVLGSNGGDFLSLLMQAAAIELKSNLNKSSSDLDITSEEALAAVTNIMQELATESQADDPVDLDS